METESSTISLKNILFNPFKSYKNELSIGLALAIIALSALTIVLLRSFEANVSIEYIFSIFVKTGINAALSVVVFLIAALVYTLITKLLIGKGKVMQLFKLIAFSLLPAIILMLVLLLVKFIGIVNVESAKEYMDFVSLIAGVWSATILAGGIKNLYAVTTERAILVAVVCFLLPIVLVLVFGLIFLGYIFF